MDPGTLQGSGKTVVRRKDTEGGPPAGPEDMGTTINGDVFQEANGPADGYAAIAQVDRLTQEPESIRKWREEQRKRLQELDAASKVTEQEWREKAKKDLEEWNQRQSEQVEKNKINNRASEEAFVKESKEETPGTEWEKVAQLCDFNPKSSKQCKDVSRLPSVLMFSEADTNCPSRCLPQAWPQSTGRGRAEELLQAGGWKASGSCSTQPPPFLPISQGWEGNTRPSHPRSLLSPSLSHRL
ncbi:PREDICTED: clathrin light chain B isoform X2 [Myotis brandtii]|uniref:clathrin light chain B isoform X2 n=1 Tax=Myotis brandtii TaxID=109478 RepID=UPI000703FB9F|nr:PREDICTED: clathrin light chain B isoform X2 [Myotis brandtii]